MMISWQEVLIRLALAALLGGLIGLESERKNWAAGLRTHMMVCVGACLIMLVSTHGFYEVINENHISFDPSRVAAQVVSGIGFIGAGAIMFLKDGIIRGLTTAAGLWTVAAIGLATGSGMYFAASATTGIALIILWALSPLEHLYSRKFMQKSLSISLYENIKYHELIFEILQLNSAIQSISMEREESEFIIRLKFEKTSNELIEKITNIINRSSEVKSYQWTM